MKKIIISLASILLSQTMYAAENLDVIDQIAAQANCIEEKNVWPGFHPNSTAIVIDAHDRHHA